jgi:hypothetical protein
VNLEIGQKVHVGCGPFGTDGVISDLTSKTITVQTDYGTLQFDKDGHELETSRVARLGLSPWEVDYDFPECQPYTLTTAVKTTDVDKQENPPPTS